MRFPRLILLGACLLVAAPALAEGLFGGPPEPGKIPSRFVRVEGVDAGLLFTQSGDGLQRLRLADVTCILGRVRFGAGFAEIVGNSLGADEPFAGMLLPLHIGYTLWSRPARTGFLYGVVPDVYLEAGGGWFALHTPFDGPAARLAICCDVDYYGFGVGLDAGALTSPPRYSYSSREYALYACLRLRVLTFGIGL